MYSIEEDTEATRVFIVVEAASSEDSLSVGLNIYMRAFSCS